MSLTTVSQELKNVQAQVDAWDAQIERYATQADSVDEYTKQAFLDELIHLRAKRDQFAEILATSNADDSVANEDTEDEKDWNDEPSDEELEKIKHGTFENDLDDDSDDEDDDDDDDDDDEEDEDVVTADSNQRRAPNYTFTELIHGYTMTDSMFQKFLIK